MGSAQIDKTGIEFSKYVFLIDSDKLDEVSTDLFGFVVTEHGLYTRDNMQQLSPGSLDGTGTYVYVERHDNVIRIHQDFSGNMGLYLYSDNSGKFVISNSFYQLFMYVKDKYSLTFNKDFANQFMTTWITSLSFDNTAINEIELIPSHGRIDIDISERSYKVEYLNHELNSIPLNSIKALTILDKWYKKWISIIRGLADNTDQIEVDLSGGFDSRLVFIFILKSGVDLNRIFIRSLNDGLHTHAEDYAIASDMADHYGFKLNNETMLDNRHRNLSKEDVYSITRHTKWSFHKEWTFPNFVRTAARFYFGGFGGETIRPYWDMSPQDLIKKECRAADYAPDNVSQELKLSVKNILDHTFSKIKAKYHITTEDDTDYSFNTFRECYSRNHFGKICYEALFTNTFKVSPIMDPDLQKLKLNDERCPDKNLLIALIFSRYGKDLLQFRFDGGREFKKETIQEAERINHKYSILLPILRRLAKSDNKFEFPVIAGAEPDQTKAISRKEMEGEMYGLFCSNEFKEAFLKVFNISTYDHVHTFADKKPYFPLRHIYSAVPLTRIHEEINQI